MLTDDKLGAQNISIASKVAIRTNGPTAGLQDQYGSSHAAGVATGAAASVFDASSELESGRPLKGSETAPPAGPSERLLQSGHSEGRRELVATSGARGLVSSVDQRAQQQKPELYGSPAKVHKGFSAASHRGKSHRTRAGLWPCLSCWPVLLACPAGLSCRDG
jgi:hypothetical protein